MRIWAISDLHLSLTGAKPMDIFGPHWTDHHLRIAAAWDALVDDDDVMLCCGDLSWADKPEQAAPDLAWLGQRPGAKVLIKGNHDYWWPKSQARLEALLPPRTWALKKRACRIGRASFFGVRGGDFAPLTRHQDRRSQAEIDRILAREEHELALSIDDLDRCEADAPQPLRRYCLCHYPPWPADRSDLRFHQRIRATGARHCLFGHLHAEPAEIAHLHGSFDGVEYRCTACDVVGFKPVLVDEVV